MKEKLKEVVLGWLIHFCVVILIINLFHAIDYYTDLTYSGRTPLEFFVYHTFQDLDTLVILICLLIIEVNYQFLFKKLNLLLFVVSSTGVVILFYAIFIIIQDVFLDFNQVLIFTSYVLVYSIIRNYLHQVFLKKELKLQKVKNELDALKAQLNPHFLFNSLNYLYGTALKERAETTADGIDKLSGLMRYTITGIHENFVSLKEELKFVDDYLTLQQARLPATDSNRINIQIPSSLPDALIAPLIILPFIENAFKYGISTDEQCFINIVIELEDNKLLIDISNSIVHGPIEIKGNNTGIKNTIKRLKLLYGHNYNLRQTNDGNTYRTTLQIALNP